MGTAEGERGSWRQITSETLQAKAESSVATRFSLTDFLCLHVSPMYRIWSLNHSVVSPPTTTTTSFLRMTEAAGAQEFRPVTLPLPITSIFPLFPPFFPVSLAVGSNSYFQEGDKPCEFLQAFGLWGSGEWREERPALWRGGGKKKEKEKERLISSPPGYPRQLSSASTACLIAQECAHPSPCGTCLRGPTPRRFPLSHCLSLQSLPPLPLSISLYPSSQASKKIRERNNLPGRILK